MKLIIPQLGEGLDSVKVIKKLVAEGQNIKKDQCYISIETDKSVVDLEIPADGELINWFYEEGDRVSVGDAVADFKLLEGNKSFDCVEKKENAKKEDAKIRSGFLIPPKTRRYLNQCNVDVDEIEKHFEEKIKILLPDHVDEYLHKKSILSSGFKEKKGTNLYDYPSQSNKDIFISSIFSAQGGKKVFNKDLELGEKDIYRTTGIESRNYLDRDENSLSLACSVVKDCLEKSETDIKDIDLIICSTGTPDQVTPSMACSILNEIAPENCRSPLGGAFDINAACSGWLYGLQFAYDFLTNSSQSKVLLVTCETLSQVLDFSDSHSSPLFGDAASATLISNADFMPRMFKLFRPSLASIVDAECSIRVPFKWVPEDYLSIEGRKVFNVAVKNMSMHLAKYCKDKMIGLEQLDWVVSHQANDRIIHAVKNKLGLIHGKFLSNIKHMGNTSSSSIPLSLDQRLDLFERDDLIGLIAFGGGFTLGSTFLQRY